MTKRTLMMLAQSVCLGGTAVLLVATTVNNCPTQHARAQSFTVTSSCGESARITVSEDSAGELDVAGADGTGLPTSASSHECLATSAGLANGGWSVYGTAILDGGSFYRDCSVWAALDGGLQIKCTGADGGIDCSGTLTP